MGQAAALWSRVSRTPARPRRVTASPRSQASSVDLRTFDREVGAVGRGTARMPAGAIGSRDRLLDGVLEHLVERLVDDAGARGQDRQQPLVLSSVVSA